MRLLLSILFLSSFSCTQNISAASAYAGDPAGTWKAAAPLLDILRYTHSDSDRYHPDPTIEAYFTRMDREGKPRILIVGCGHYDAEVHAHGSRLDDGDHLHPDTWCVNVSNPNKFHHGRPMENFHKSIKANDELDITDSDAPLHNYTGQFDIVVLERIWSGPLSIPYAYYNSAKILKTGGYLFVETHSTYSITNRDFAQIGSTATEILRHINPTREEEIYTVTTSVIDKKDEEYEKEVSNSSTIYGGKTIGAQYTSARNKPFNDITPLLELLFFKHISNTQIPSPFSGRNSNFLIAQKTDLTRLLLKDYSPHEQKRAKDEGYTGTKNPLFDAIKHTKEERKKELSSSF